MRSSLPITMSMVALTAASLAVLTACASTVAPTTATPDTDGGGSTPGQEAGSPADASGHDASGHDAGGGTKDAGAPLKDSSANTPEASVAAVGSYTVSGPTILDATGKPHLFRGVARPSLEFNSFGDQLAEGDYQVMAAWHANVVRISLNQDFWLQSDASGKTNPSYDPAYAATVDQQVQWAEKSKLDVILDLHWSDKGDFGNEAQCKGGSSGCQQVMADAHSVLFWQQVATKYKNDPRVLFELYNEPNLGSYQPQATHWNAWLHGDTTNAYGFPVVGMQQLYDTVRATGATNLVIIGGLSWSFDLSGVASNPVNGTNIIYATHPYQTDAQNMWTSSFGNLSAKYPIIATEFGDHSSSCSTNYASNFIAYANKKGTNGDNPANELSWTAWAFYVANNPCTFPTLLTDWYGPNAFGTVVQQALTTGP